VDTVDCAGKDQYLCTFCGVTFQRPNPLKSHIRYHCPAHKSTPVIPDGLPSVINADFSLLPRAPPTPWFLSWLPGFPAVWSAPPLVLTALAARSRGGNHQAMTSYADDVTGTTVGVQNAGTRWMDYIQQILRTENDSAARTVKLRNVTGDVTKLTSDVTVTSVVVEQTRTQPVPARSKPRESDRYVCPYCGKLYSRRYGLKIHIRTHTGFKPLQCSVCGRPFGDPSNLNKHIRLHAQSSADSGSSATYRCRHCGKVLVRRRDLDRHLRTRHADQYAPTSDVVATSVALVTSSECVSADDDDDRRLADEAEIAT